MSSVFQIWEKVYRSDLHSEADRLEITGVGTENVSRVYGLGEGV